VEQIASSNLFSAGLHPISKQLFIRHLKIMSKKFIERSDFDSVINWEDDIELLEIGD